MISTAAKESQSRPASSSRRSSTSAMPEPDDTVPVDTFGGIRSSSLPATHDRLLRATQFYWKELVALKALCIYHRVYRDEQAKWNTRLGFVKAIATSSTIAGWAIWQNYAIIWGAIIAASQLIDALKDVFPNARSRKSSADLANALETLFIDARIEFEKVSFGNVTPEDANVSLRKLQKSRHDAETKYFPEGIVQKLSLQDEANRQTRIFFKQVYGSDEKADS
jgi:hypothetical protein